MNTSPLSQTESLWNQHFQLVPGLKAGSDSESHFFVENTTNQNKYALQEWQMTLMSMFQSGNATIGEAVRHTAPQFPGEVNEDGVRQFCQWLLDVELVTQRTEPKHFSHIEEPKAATEPTATEGAPQLTLVPEPAPQLKEREAKRITPPKKSWASRGNGVMGNLVKIAACVALGLGTWKYSDAILPMINGASSDNFAATAASAVESDTASASAAAPQNDTEKPETESLVKTGTARVDPQTKLANLRIELSRYQTERDECYKNSDEDGYRIAVQKIAHITHQIGKIQAKLETQQITVDSGIAFGGNKINL